MIEVIRESILLEERMVIPLTHRPKFASIWKAKRKLLELLVISSLVLQSNFSSAGPEKESRNRAVFRLSGIVFFTSDIKKSLSSLKVLSCLGSKASQRSFIEVYSSSDFSKPLPSAYSLSDDKLLSLIKIEKLKIAALGRSKESLSKKELLVLSKDCARLRWSKLNDDEKSILLAEVFLRDRFGQEKDLYNRLVEYSRSLSIQESHEVYASGISIELAKKLRSLKKSIKVAAEDGQTEPLPSEVIKKKPFKK